MVHVRPVQCADSIGSDKSEKPSPEMSPLQRGIAGGLLKVPFSGVCCGVWDYTM